MNRIIRTALASVGAAVVITGGSLGVAYATAPSSPPASASTGDTDQVAALNQAADDLLAKIATLEKQLASTPDPTASASALAKQEDAAPSTQTAFPAAQVTRTTAPAQAPASAASAAASTTAQRTGEKDSQNGNNTND
jgi:hypothetical protein